VRRFVIPVTSQINEYAQFKNIEGEISMKRIQKSLLTLLCGYIISGSFSCKNNPVDSQSNVGDNGIIIINHNTTNINRIPVAWIDSAKSKLRIAYGHTSHGSQLITGMDGLIPFKGNKFSYNETGANGALNLKDTPFSNASDLGNPDRVAWATATRTFLNTNSNINVVIWSWCGQVSNADSADIVNYLVLMSLLEKDYPSVRFVYMTGHLDGSGSAGNLNLRNQQIRDYC
jgi:hypothetical protein